MREFELTLLLDQLEESVEDVIYSRYDALIAGHADYTRLTVTAPGSDVVDAARNLLEDLKSFGIIVRAISEDFVSRSDIAERAGVSRQGVGLWVRGERHNDQPFPSMYSSVSGGIWLWGDVDRWLRGHVSGYGGDPIEYPSREEHAALTLLVSEFGQRSPEATSTERVERHAKGRHQHAWAAVAIVRGVDVTLAA